MAAHRLTEIRCDICNEAESEWNVTTTWLRNLLKDDGWKITATRDLCPRCAREVK